MPPDKETVLIKDFDKNDQLCNKGIIYAQKLEIHQSINHFWFNDQQIKYWWKSFYRMDQTKKYQFLNRLMSSVFSLLFILGFSSDQMKAYCMSFEA